MRIIRLTRAQYAVYPYKLLNALLSQGYMVQVLTA